MMGNVFWYMLDIDNYQLITSKHVLPSDLTDKKDIVLAETPIPGLNFRPVSYGGGGNRHLSFTLPLIRRDQYIGNMQLLNQFEQLRNQSMGFTKIFSGQFTPNPRVLYQWGTHSTPQIYHVAKCNFSNRSDFVNQTGFPQYTMIDIELILDETNPLYMMEEVYRRVQSITGIATSVVDFMMRRKPV
jgi:hypothetical protein